MKKIVPALLLSALAIGCKHPLDIIGEGDITSLSGNRDCYYEWAIDPNHPQHSACADNEVLAPDEYVETFYGQARTGWHFHRWANYCKNAVTNECSFNISASLVQQAAGFTVKPLYGIFREDVISGYKSLFMGHSLFDPMAVGMAFHANEAGVFPNHSQETFLYYSAAGAPINIWNDPFNKAEIQAELDEGDVALFVMPIHHDHVDIQGYRLWTDYALQQNPDTRIAIGIPWLWWPHNYADAEAYDAAWHTFVANDVHPIVDQLRLEFPHTDFFTIPYGQASGELYKLFEDGQLPDVTSAVEVPGHPEAIWLDLRPHPDFILVELAQLVFLASIYGVDMTTYAYDPGYITDLKAIADDIMGDQDPNYAAPYAPYLP